MRRRSPAMKQTQNGLSVLKILDALQRFPMLHAYGVGFDVFRELPEQSRMKALDFAKFSLGYALDDEIDSAVLFYKALKPMKYSKQKNLIRATYLVHMYTYWRTLTCKHSKTMPLGVMILGALMVGNKVVVVPDMKPDALVAVHKKRLEFMEEFLIKDTRMPAWPTEKKRHPYFYDEIDDREGEVGNEPQGTNAVEQNDGE